MFNILKQININPAINEKELALKCKISLDKVNSILGYLEQNKFIFRETQYIEKKYHITESGLNLLKEEVESKQNIQVELNNKNITTAVILAAGKNNNFNETISMLKINEEVLIERTINLLRNNKIENIIVVSGYRSEEIKDKLDDDITIVENLEYKWTGTMYSLASAKEYINDDFILIEGDIVIEDLGVKEIIKNNYSNCILITAESGSGDEAFVEIKDNKIYKISKDIAQFNKIHGEMIGISKISFDFY